MVWSGEKKKRGQGLTRPGPIYPLLALPLAEVNEDALKLWYDREALAGKHQAARALMMFRGFLRWCSARPEFRHLTDRDNPGRVIGKQNTRLFGRAERLLDGGRDHQACRCTTLGYFTTAFHPWTHGCCHRPRIGRSLQHHILAARRAFPFFVAHVPLPSVVGQPGRPAASKSRAFLRNSSGIPCAWRAALGRA